MNEINYTNSIAQLFGKDITAHTDTVNALQRAITASHSKTKEERSKAYLMTARDLIMKVYVQ